MIKLTKLQNICNNNNNNNNLKYEYKNVNFLYKPNLSAKNLIVFLHGRAPLCNSEPIYRGYNYEYKNSSVLCLSDALRQIYKQSYCWYLSTDKFNFENIYIEIIKYIGNKYKNIIFTGTSAGGYFSLYLASIFNQYALISNSQIFLPDCTNKNISYDKIVKNIKNKNDSIIYKDIRECFKHNKPKKIILFCNINDKLSFKHSNILLDCLLEYNIDFEDNIFLGKNPVLNETHHQIQFPTCKHKDVINLYINKLNN